MKRRTKTIFNTIFVMVFVVLAAAILPSALLPRISSEAIEIMAAFMWLMSLTVVVILIFQRKVVQ